MMRIYLFKQTLFVRVRVKVRVKILSIGLCNPCFARSWNNLTSGSMASLVESSSLSHDIPKGCLFLSLVMSCVVLVLSCVVLSCLVLPWLVLSCRVLCCLFLSCVVFCCLKLLSSNYAFCISRLYLHDYYWNSFKSRPFFECVPKTLLALSCLALRLCYDSCCFLSCLALYGFALSSLSCFVLNYGCLAFWLRFLVLLCFVFWSIVFWLSFDCLLMIWWLSCHVSDWLTECLLMWLSCRPVLPSYLPHPPPPPQRSKGRRLSLVDRFTQMILSCLALSCRVVSCRVVSGLVLSCPVL